MKHPLLTFLAGASLTAFSAGIGENTPRKMWSLTPEAKSLVARLAASARNYRPVAPQPHLFSRAQLKYGAHRDDFIHNWYDRPLHQDSSWGSALKHGQLLDEAAWRKTAETVRLGKMDGLAACIGHVGRGEIIGRSVLPGGEMTVLVELPYAAGSQNLASFMDTAAKAFKMPNAFRLNGRIVLTRYPASNEKEIAFAEKFRAALAEKYGPEAFAVMFYVAPFAERIGPRPFSEADVEKTRAHLRNVLRRTDGLFLTSSPGIWTRRYQGAFVREVLTPIVQSVLAEPEFAGRKCFGLQVAGGHENCYRWSYSIDSEGTRQLCERLESVRQMRPDFVLLTEWDEENENTFFRPTIANGFVTQRILRYFADRFASRRPETFPGDDLSIPNLVVSYRRSLVAGEPVEVEVRNIPDGTFAGATYTLRLAWRDGAGNTVASYPARTLSADRLEAVTFVSRASDLVSARVVTPRLEVTAGDGRRWTFGEDFWPLDVAAVRAIDAKWAKHALRERAKGIAAKIAFGKTDAAGAIAVTGEFRSAVPVRSVEVLEGPNTVYMYDAHAPAAGDVRLKIELQARASTPRDLTFNGTIGLEGAPHGRVLPSRVRGVTTLSTGWRLRGVRNVNWPSVFLLSVPSNECETAEIAVALPPNYETRLRVKDIVAKEVFGVTGPAGGNLVASLLRETMYIPKPVGAREGRFAFSLKPVSSTGVCRLQIVDADYRVWHGAPLTFCRPSGKMRTVTVRERDEGIVRTLTLDAHLIEEPTFDFGATRGSVVWSPTGRAFSGILGGAATLVTGFGRGESCYGDAFAKYLVPSEYGLSTAPARAAGPKGEPALAFSGAQYASLPLQIVPKFAAFEVSLDVKADDLAGTAPLVDAGNAAWGLWLEKGVPTAFYFSTERYAREEGAQFKAQGPRVTAGVWHHVVVRYDERTLAVSVDGVSGQPVPAEGYQMQSRYATLGGANRLRGCHFHGTLANLKIRVL